VSLFPKLGKAAQADFRVFRSSARPPKPIFGFSEVRQGRPSRFSGFPKFGKAAQADFRVFRSSARLPKLIFRFAEVRQGCRSRFSGLPKFGKVAEAATRSACKNKHKKNTSQGGERKKIRKSRLGLGRF